MTIRLNMAYADVARFSSQSSKTHSHNDNQEEDSLKVRAFAEDTASRMCTTWPPRSYTCSFCRRGFRSAQALGGHMNVHRRDRARLHQITKKNPMKNSNPNSNPSTFNTSLSSTSRGSTLLIPNQEFLVNGRLCLLYQLHNGIPNTILSSSPYLASNKSPSSNFIATIPEATHPSSVTSKGDHQNSSRHILSASLNKYSHENSVTSEGGHNILFNTEELDLELRLGHGPTISYLDAKN